MEPSHVLVPLDGSPLSDDALAHALAVFDCPVTLLNVVTPVDASMSEGGIIEADDQRAEEAIERAESMLTEARARAGEDEQRVETVVETGDPAETILAYLGDHDVDHVVMGGHGGDAGAVTRRLLGTVATKVVGDAPVTVTVVR